MTSVEARAEWWVKNGRYQLPLWSMARGVPQKHLHPQMENYASLPLMWMNDVVRTNGEHIRSIPKYSKVALMIFMMDFNGLIWLQHQSNICGRSWD